MRMLGTDELYDEIIQTQNELAANGVIPRPNLRVTAYRLGGGTLTPPPSVGGLDLTTLLLVGGLGLLTVVGGVLLVKKLRKR
jgi:hypothetical protein